MNSILASLKKLWQKTWNDYDTFFNSLSAQKTKRTQGINFLGFKNIFSGITKLFEKRKVLVNNRSGYIGYSFIDLLFIRIIISIGPGHCGHVQDFGFVIAFRWCETTSCDGLTLKPTKTISWTMRIFWLIDLDVIFTIITKKIFEKL